MRHGQSTWNQERRFSGWGDPPLSATGRAQALAAGRLMAAKGAAPGAVFCSVLTRARQTLTLVLKSSGLASPTAFFSWRLNERHCGQWEGRPKPREAGTLLSRWRSDLSARPLPLEPEDARHPGRNPRYQDVDPAALPAGESYDDLLARLRPLWRDHIAPALHRHDCVWAVAHAGSLWGLANLILAEHGGRLAPWRLAPAAPVSLNLDRGLRPVKMVLLGQEPEGGDRPWRP